MKIIVTEFITLDGVIEAPGEETSLGKLGGWTLPFFNEEAMAYKLVELQEMDYLLLGKNTYDGFSQAWSTRTDDQGFAEKMNSVKKYIATSSNEKLIWNNSEKIQGDIIETLKQMKQKQSGIAFVMGSGDLTQELIQNNLIDEFRLMTFPIILGAGSKLFREYETKTNLLLDTQKSFGTGVTISHYTVLQ